MQLIRGWHNLKKLTKRSVVTIGNFDGVHRGHQSLLQDMRQRADELKALSVVVIFEPHPLELFTPDKAPARLMKLREKLIALQANQVDVVVCLRFNRWLANMSAEGFVKDLLVDKLRAQTMVVGDDFRFGAKRQGDVALLQQMGEQYDFTVDEMPTYTEGEDRISSTRVRNALANDDLTTAEQLLGRRYALVGKVVHGDRIGRQMGYPTANLYLHRTKVAITGVFVVRVKINNEGEWLYGAANLGTRPAVKGTRILLEVYLFDFNRDIYGQNLQVELLHKIRDEQPFDSLEALKLKIDEDVDVARQWLVETLSSRI
ncbi:MAG: bifunctional riboflavin kinase/FAD synthetase [Coxiellaceae bacterium]|nr:bifunctional riboflavin kinase/FAD synthetase [Coxiellaceae bacterium]